MSALRESLAVDSRGPRRDLVGVLPGEGIGPEVVGVALDVLRTLGEACARPFEIRQGGAIGLESKRRHGAALSTETTAFCSEVFGQGGALFCGAGSERFVYELRERFDLYCKFTPLQPLPALRHIGPLRPERLQGIDIIAVRENVGGLYFGAWGREEGDAFHRFGYSAGQVDRILDVALRLARQRRGRLCLALKREGVPSISQLWMERLELRRAALAVDCEVLDVDNLAYQLIADPQRFDVLVSSNMFGDILADTGSLLLGSRGLSYSGNFGPHGRACYQTGHGAAWDLAGQDRANPVGQVLSLAMMLDESFSWPEGAALVRQAVQRVLGEGERTADLLAPDDRAAALGTRALGERLCQAVSDLARARPASRGVTAQRAHWLLRNPSRWDEVLAEVPVQDAAEVQQAVDTARRRQADAQHRSPSHRVDGLQRLRPALLARQPRFEQALVRDLGKPVRDARAEFAYGLELLDHGLSVLLADTADAVLPGVTSGHAAVRVRPRALGPVGLITPFNQPLAIALGKLVPALGFGNTVVWKPALPAAGVVQLLADALAEAGLEDQVLTLSGDAGTGRALLASRGLGAVSLTGSIAAGREAAATCALRGIPLQAELGGNNAVLIGRSADLALAATQIARAAYAYAGQRCTAPRRLIVDAAIRPAFEDALLQAIASLQQGRPEDEATDVGPLISRAAQSRVLAQVRQALHQGARCLAGAEIPAAHPDGCWIAPTLITDVAPGSDLVQHESFGPVTVLLQAGDFEHALALCNDVAQGLMATLFSHDAEEQMRFQRHAEAGMLVLNHAPPRIAASAPFAAWKASGLGPPEHGRWDLEFYSRPQALYGL